MTRNLNKKIGHKKDKKIGHGFALLHTKQGKTWQDKTTPSKTREQQGDVSAIVYELLRERKLHKRR
jgi:hypothetical protein